MGYKSKLTTTDDPLLKTLIREEGWKDKPYRCTAGYLTIGVGHNLDASGLCDEAVLAQLKFDTDKARTGAQRIAIGWWENLDPVRQDVLVLMVFQLGEKGARQFTQTLTDISLGRYASAAERIRKSKWAAQTPQRVARLALLLERGSYDGINEIKYK